MNWPLIHKAHQSDIAAGFIDVDLMSGTDLAEINFPATQTDAPARGDLDGLIVEGNPPAETVHGTLTLRVDTPAIIPSLAIHQHVECSRESRWLRMWALCGRWGWRAELRCVQKEVMCLCIEPHRFGSGFRLDRP